MSHFTPRPIKPPTLNVSNHWPDYLAFLNAPILVWMKSQSINTICRTLTGRIRRCSILRATIITRHRVGNRTALIHRPCDENYTQPFRSFLRHRTTHAPHGPATSVAALGAQLLSSAQDLSARAVGFPIAFTVMTLSPNCEACFVALRGLNMKHKRWK